MVLVAGRDRSAAERLSDELRLGAEEEALVSDGPAVLELVRREPGAVNVVVLAPDVAEPVSVAQGLGRHARQVSVVILVAPDNLAAVNRALLFAPFLGEDVRCVEATDAASLADEVAAAAARSRRRREHRVAIAAAQRRLDPAEKTVPNVASYLGHLLDYAPIGVLTLDQEGDVVALNALGAALLGADPARAPGRPLDEVTTPATAEALRQIAARAGPDLAHTGVVEAARGEAPCFLDVTASTYAGPLSERRVVLVLLDVTDRVAAEDERQRALERLRRLQAVTDAALSNLGLSDLLTELLDRIRALLGVETATILLLEGSPDVLHVRATRGAGSGAREGARVRLGSGLAGRVALERRALRLEDLSDDGAALEPESAAVLGVPLIVAGRVLGVLQVGSRRERRFTDDDEQLLALVADRAALAIQHARAYEHERETAETLQRSLLPDQLPELDAVRMATRYLPSTESHVGGDWYDAFVVPSGSLFVVIGDVVGRGVVAASIMGQLRSATRAYALEGHGPAAVISNLERLVDRLLPGVSATIALACVDAVSGEVHLARAGHLPPLVVRAQGSGHLVFGGGSPPLGAIGERVPGQAREHLAAGDALLLCTDGLVERRDESLEHGLQRLLEAATHGPADPESLCDHLMAEMISDGQGDDDVALLVLRRVGRPQPLARRVLANARELASVRADLRAWLSDNGADDASVHAVVLATGEACANAILHGSARRGDATFDLEARRDDADVVITIRDHGRWQPGPRPDGGRGLPLMRALMDAVHVDATQDGTTLVLRLAIEPGQG